MELIGHIRLRPGMYIGMIGDGAEPDHGIYTLLREIVNNSVDEFTDGYGTEIIIDIEKVNKALGMDIPTETMVDILTKLGVKVNGDKLEIPYFRIDIERTADIVEEVIRIYGYDKLNSTLINAESTVGSKTKVQKLEDKIKELLVEKGFSEMYAFSFISANDFEKCKLDSTKAIKIKNPLGEDYSLMRTDMMPTVLQSITTNYNKKNKDVSLFEIGKTYTGTISKIADYGIFVDLGLAKGLAHKSELVWDKNQKLEDKFNINDEIEVKIKDFNKEEKRISLEYPLKGENPWFSLANKYKVSDIVTCKVIKFASFGAFLEIEKGLEGLVHNSEITSLKRVVKPEDELQLGQTINAKIIDIDKERLKIGLSIKEIEGTSAEYGYEEYIKKQ